MTISHQETKGGSPLFTNHWGPERSVVLHKSNGESLGFSIISGKVLHCYFKLNINFKEAFFMF